MRLIFQCIFYNKALRSYIYIYILAIGGQSAGPKGFQGVTKAKNNRFFRQVQNLLKISRETPGTSASLKIFLTVVKKILFDFISRLYHYLIRQCHSHTKIQNYITLHSF